MILIIKEQMGSLIYSFMGWREREREREREQRALAVAKIGEWCPRNFPQE